ncbi:MAG: TonB family protein [Candidatus Eremiobacteraeota bacterium]|nr:TonB family protein [Candidatus Eremiobacteraeota bacterium]
MSSACQRAEVLAGAIALDEAGDAEREEYRGHLSGCSRCLEALGGEFAIERAMATVREARASETWQPVLTPVLSKHERRMRSFARFGLSAAIVAIVASIGLHFLVTSNLGRIAATPSNPIVINYDGSRITLEHRPARTVKTRIVAAAPHLVVVHNVVTLKEPRIRTEVKRDANSVMKSTTTIVAQAASSPVPEDNSDVPIWRRADPLPASRRGIETVNPAPLRLEGRAESIALAPVLSIRDVMPIGGESAIDPKPPMIAYSEGAEGTTAFAVSVDERGLPMKCTITQSSGSLALDEAVCGAAMKAHFSPRLVNGRPTPSIYRDAFTFRNSANSDGLERTQPQ